MIFISLVQLEESCLSSVRGSCHFEKSRRGEYKYFLDFLRNVNIPQNRILKNSCLESSPRLKMFPLGKEFCLISEVSV